MNLRDLQAEVGEWHRRHFPEADDLDVVLKTVEEVGELAKATQRCRDEMGAGLAVWKSKRADAIGDVVICLAALCEQLGKDFAEVVAGTWSEVKARSAERIRR